MIEVYHAYNTRDSLFFGSQDVGLDVVRNFRTNGQYRKVAYVSSDNLDRAYELTNTIHHHWSANRDVTPMYRNDRSTSVGDILVRGDTAYLVCSVGFAEIPK